MRSHSSRTNSPFTSFTAYSKENDSREEGLSVQALGVKLAVLKISFII